MVFDGRGVQGMGRMARYIREVKDVQGTSDMSQILKDIQKVFSRSNTEGRTQCLQS